ncbi:MAG: glutathione S-transferase N-terminal domain-containing protein [Pseudomonadales bacterium]|nr:glutathione S-transferase N-terminal domain-containing protein [Pseudomonadales bacterium]
MHYTHPLYEVFPPRQADAIQLYSMNTPNGIKVASALEEMGLAYEPHLINILKGDQHTPAFAALNPNGKIPAIIDPNGSEDEAVTLMESCAILLYLAEKSGKFMPDDNEGKRLCQQWLFFQAAHIGPMFGQFGHFYKFATETCDHPYPVNRYTQECKRLLGVLDKQLEQRVFMLGSDYSIVDMSIYPWVNTLVGFYEARDHIGFDDYPAVERWLQKCIARPASIKAQTVCALSH